MARCLFLALAVVLATMPPVSAQRGGGGGDLSLGISPMQLSRLERLELVFKLDKEQKKSAKAIFDAAFKAAATVRTDLAATRAALGQAIITAKPQSEIEATARSYGVPAAAMTTIEMQALADLLKTLTPDQRQNGAAIRTAFSLVRGMFLDPKKWDEIPEAQGY